jgi:rfaE bifunctional protein kinase chain/domain
VATEGILVRPGYRTPTKVRILGGGKHSIKQQIVRYDIEETLTLTGEERQRLAAALERWSAGSAVRAAILSDYGYGTVEPGLLPRIRQALGPAATLVCDSRYRLGDFAGLDGATPNEEEAEALLGASINDDPARLEEAGRRLRDLLGARFVLITRGSRGMSLFQDGGSAHLPVHGTDQVADVTGAGDTVIGTFALALAAGATPLEASLLANYAGGVVVMKMGTATLTPEELRHAVASDPRPIEEVRWERS